jgi:hypothetical protein
MFDVNTGKLLALSNNQIKIEPKTSESYPTLLDQQSHEP